MKRTLLSIGGLILALLNHYDAASQNTKTWVGASGGSWSTASNWSPAIVPTSSDTVIFNSANPVCEVDINPSIASLRVISSNAVLRSSIANRTISIDNAGDATPVLKVNSGTSLSLGQAGFAFGVSVTTHGASGTNNAQIEGTLFMGYTSTWTVNNVGLTAFTNVDISGTVYLVSSHTAAVFTNSTLATVKFLSGSSLTWARNGGTVSVADYQDGSTISVTGVVGLMPTFSATSNFNGLLIWNNSSQTVSGASAVLLPTSSTSMDSVRVMSTGTGSLRMFGNPSGYTIGDLEVQGGTLEMGSPVTSAGSCTINSGLKISGGTV